MLDFFGRCGFVEIKDGQVMRLYRVTLEYTAKRVVYVEASDCDEAADTALENFEAEPQPDDVVEDGSAEVVESVHDRDP